MITFINNVLITSAFFLNLLIPPPYRQLPPRFPAAFILPDFYIPFRPAFYFSSCASALVKLSASSLSLLKLQQFVLYPAHFHYLHLQACRFLSPLTVCPNVSP